MDRRNDNIVRIAARTRILGDRKTQRAAMRLGRLGVGCQVVLKLAGKALLGGRRIAVAGFLDDVCRNK